MSDEFLLYGISSSITKLFPFVGVDKGWRGGCRSAMGEGDRDSGD